MTDFDNDLMHPPGVGAQAEDILAGLLDAIPEQDRDKLNRIARLRDIEEGTVVQKEGDPVGSVGYLLHGALGMQKTLSDARVHIIGLLVPSDMFGRLFDGPCHYDVIALTRSRILEFDRPELEQIVSHSLEAETLLMARILDELDSAREWLLLMGGHKVSERVASFLLVLLRRSVRKEYGNRSSGKRPLVHIPIRRTDLARYLGTRPESLSRALHELCDIGAIDLIDPYCIEVKDLATLVRASGSDLVVPQD